METGNKTPKSEVLRRMSYSELKKMAKRHGIKGNMKAQKIISALCSLDFDDSENFLTPENDVNSSRKDSDAFESFSTPSLKEINSSRKNKEEKFDEDKMTPLPTPRRGTYSLESPEPVKEEDTSLAPIAFDSSVLDMSNVTVGRGSERKLRRKVSFVSPTFSPSTPKNPSIKLRPKTPIASRASLGKRVSLTPLASHASLGKRVSFTSPAAQQKGTSFEKPLHSTPHPKNSLGKRRSVSNIDTSEMNVTNPLPSVAELAEIQEVTSTVKQSKNDSRKSVSNIEASEMNVTNPLPSVAELAEPQDDTSSVKQSQNDSKLGTEKSVTRSQAASKATGFTTPGSSKSVVPKHDASVKIKRLATPSIEKSVTRGQSASKVTRFATPGSSKSVLPKPGASAKIKRLATPNFKKIHEKAFEKMESIDDYQKRKQENSAKKITQHLDFKAKSKVTKDKSKIPAFKGIPFIPAASSVFSKTKTQDLKTKNVVPSSKAKKVKNINENVQKKKTKFDLKASLSRKLGYTPYKGPVKPLAESNVLNTSSGSCLHHPREPVNKVVNSNRLQTRSVLRGVRTNKRFELQMKNRKMD